MTPYRVRGRLWTASQAAVAQFDAEALVVTQTNFANRGRRQSPRLNVVEQRRMFRALESTQLATVNPGFVLDRRLNGPDTDSAPVSFSRGSILDRRLNR